MPSGMVSTGDTALMQRAVVLGGGGLTGVAWLTGVLSAFEDAGVPVGDADLVVGTSAGSVVGSQLVAGRPFADQYRFLGAEHVRAREMLVRLYQAMPKPDGEVLMHLASHWRGSKASTAESRALEG